MTIAVVALYLLAIVAANLLVAVYGPAASVPIAFVFIGFDLTARDRLHDAWTPSRRPLYMGLLIAAGGLLSYALNSSAGIIAIASTAAFVLASCADWTTYAVLGDRSRLIRVNASNVAGATVDSVVFVGIAFGISGNVLLILAQLAAKVAGGLFWYAVLNVRRRRYAEPEPWELEYQTGPDPEVDW